MKYWSDREGRYINPMLMYGGLRYGKTAKTVARIKRTPGHRLLVRDLCNLDIYIKMGLQPSQIVLPSELDNGSIIKTGGME